MYFCKECINIISKQIYQSNIEKHRERSKKYYNLFRSLETEFNKQLN